MKPTRIPAAAIATAVIAGNVWAQGSLTPSPGVPAPTMKTLEQVEPRIDLATVTGDATYHHVITNSGSYYLSDNLAVTNVSGIYINAAGVTLDLNGFEISRTYTSGGSGILIGGSIDGATVRNGTIIGFNIGISASGSCLLENLVVSECEGEGIQAGNHSRIINCHALENTGSGIFTGDGSALTACNTYSNGAVGIYAGSNSYLNACGSSYNTGWYGIYADAGSSLRDCTSTHQLNNGFDVGSGSSLRDCTARDNQGDGIEAGGGSSLSGCTASDNTGNGINAGEGSSLSGCTASDNTGNGINTSDSLLSGCVASDNESDGIDGGFYSSIKDCTVGFNQGYGIDVKSYCSVVGNTCFANGLAGIRAFITNNRIDSNNLTANHTGIEAGVAGNLIVRNNASSNTSTNYLIFGVGTIQTSPIGAGAWDNFEF